MANPAPSLGPEWEGKGEEAGAQWRLVGQGKGHVGKVLHSAFSTPHGRLAVTGGEDGTVRLWDPTTGRQLGNPLRHSDSDVYCTAIYTESALENGTGDGLAWILSGGKDKVLRVWEVTLTVERKSVFGSPSGKYTSAVVGGMKVKSARLVAERQLPGAVTAVAWKGKSRLLLTVGNDTRVMDLVPVPGDASVAGRQGAYTLEERVAVVLSGQLVAIDTADGPTEDVLILTPNGKLQGIEATVKRQKVLDLLGEGKSATPAQFTITPGGRRLVAITPSSLGTDAKEAGEAGPCATTVTVWEMDRLRQALNAPITGSRSGPQPLPAPLAAGLSTPTKKSPSAVDSTPGFSPHSPSSPRAKFEFLENTFDAAAAVASVPVDLPNGDFIILTAAGKTISVWQSGEQVPTGSQLAELKSPGPTTRSLKRVGTLNIAKPDGVEIESLCVSKGGAYMTSISKVAKSDDRILCFWVANTLVHTLHGEGAVAVPSIPSPVRATAVSTSSTTEALPASTKQKLLDAFPDRPKRPDGSDMPLEEVGLQIVEELCEVRFAARLIAPAQQRIQEIEQNPKSRSISETPIVTMGLEAERRRAELVATMRSLEEQLTLCQVDYSLAPKDLEPKLQARDTARAESVRLWNLLKKQQEDLTAHLAGKLPMSNVTPTKDDPSPREIYARIEQKELSNLKECTDRVVQLVDRFTASFRSGGASFASGPVPQYQEEYAAAIHLRDALLRSNGTQMEEEFCHQTAELHRQLASHVAKSEQTLGEVQKTINDLEEEMKTIIAITKATPFGSDGTTPRALARKRLVAVKENFIDPIEVQRHKKNQISRDLEFYRTRDSKKCSDLSDDMNKIDLELGKLAEGFDYNVVTTIREAFPELEEYVHTEIDPYCGQGNFRMNLGPSDFTMTKLYGDTVFKASPISAAVAEAKKLEQVYIIKRFDVFAVLMRELSAMRNARTDGKHHENVAEECFTFSQKDLGGVVYFFLGLPFYRSSSPDWFIARIKAGEKGAIIQAMIGMVKGLDCLHHNEVIHGDIKPANLLFDSEKATGVPKWIDFNFSNNRNATLKLRGLKTVASTSVGYSEGFTAPEQRSNNINSESADVYALGKTFAALLFIADCSPWEKEERKAGTWREDEVKNLFGAEIHSQIVTMIQCMTREDEPQRIFLLKDGTFGLSVINRLENIRKAL